MFNFKAEFEIDTGKYKTVFFFELTILLRAW